eukprot:scaffold13565_cov191-Alexandrium_tamarense.AAC.1
MKYHYTCEMNVEKTRMSLRPSNTPNAQRCDIINQHVAHTGAPLARALWWCCRSVSSSDKIQMSPSGIWTIDEVQPRNHQSFPLPINHEILSI